jgi:hypothetical protein
VVTREPSDVTVVITPRGTSESEQIGQVLASWAAAGFVRRFLWWDGLDDDRHQVVWNDDPDRPLPLLEALAAAPYDTIRLVTLLPVVSRTEPVPTVLPELSADVEDLVARHLAANQKLAKVGLLIPATGAEHVPRQVLSNRWHITVIAVDEDSVDPEHASRDVHDPEHFAAHAALALATVAGLWCGMDGGPFDGDNEGAGQQEPRVRLIRCHARGGRSYGLSDDIVREALTRRADPLWVAEMLGARPAGNSDHLAVRAGDEFLAGPGTSMTRTPFHAPRRQRIRVTPRTAIHLLWLFMRGRIVELRQELRQNVANEVRDRIEDFTQRLVFGNTDTDLVVKFDGRPLDDEDGAGFDAESVDVAKALMDAVRRPPVPQTYPAEWRALRELSFGLVDAGALPDGCTEPMAGVHRQVVAGHAVSAPPGELGTANTRPEPESRDDDPLGGAADDAEFEPMLARIGRRIAEDTETARLEFLRAIETLKSNLPGKPGQTPVDRRSWYAWLLLTLITVGGLVAAIVLYASDELTLRDAVGVAAASIVIFLLGTSAILFQYLRKAFQEANKANRLWERYENARLAAGHEAAELVRLSAVRSLYEQWQPVLARSLHVAASDAVRTPEDTTELDELSRPSAFTVGEAETDPRLLARLSALIGRRTFQRGWLSALYARVLAESMDELKFRRGLPAEAADPDPDTEPAAQHELAGRMRDGLADRTVIDDIRDIIGDQIRSLHLTELFCAIHWVRAEATSPTTFFSVLQDTGGARVARFNRRLWTEESGYPTVTARTTTWLPDRLNLLEVAPSTLVLPLTVPEDHPLMVVLAARLDQTEPLVWSALTLFSAAEFTDERLSENTATEDTADVVW